jgi:hypothetical protein
MNAKEKTLKKKKSKDKLKLASEKADAKTKAKANFDIYKLLDNEEFLRALKEKLETV